MQLWNETHSGMKVDPVSYKKPLGLKRKKKLKAVVFWWIPALQIKIYMEDPGALDELKCVHVQLKTLGVVISENGATLLEQFITFTYKIIIDYSMQSRLTKLS